MLTFAVRNPPPPGLKVTVKATELPRFIVAGRVMPSMVKSPACVPVSVMLVMISGSPPVFSMVKLWLTVPPATAVLPKSV